MTPRVVGARSDSPPPATLRDVALSARVTSTRLALIADGIATSTAVASASAMPNASSTLENAGRSNDASSPNVVLHVLAGGVITAIAHHASTTPAAPPMTARTEPSASVSTNSRRVLLPSAARTAYSRCRAAARPSIRLITFVHASRCNSATAPSRTTNERRTIGPARAVFSAIAVAMTRSSGFRGSLGNARLISAPRTASSLRADSRLTPARRRPTTEMKF